MVCVICIQLQYSELAAEVHKGRGRIPVADYKIVKSFGEGDAELPEQNRSCYSFCMCPGGQVSCSFVVSLTPSSNIGVLLVTAILFLLNSNNNVCSGF